MNPTPAPNRVPAGVPTGGQFATSARAEAHVGLTPNPTVEDVIGAPGFEVAMDVWDSTEEPDSFEMDAVIEWGERLRAASEEDRPGFTDLAAALDRWHDLDAHDLDAAADVAEAISAIASRVNMDVVQDGNGGHLRIADGKPGHTCPHCGNGYATARVLCSHLDHDCTAADADADVDADDTDDAVAAEEADEVRHSTLHDAAEHFASEINNAGRASQVAFLRRMGVSDDEILRQVTWAQASDQSLDQCLDELVHDVCSRSASEAYNSGEDDPAAVTRDLNARRWLTSHDKTLVDKHPLRLAAGECTDYVVRAGDRDVVYRISYTEEIPLGDGGYPAHDYRRGEYAAEAEWHAHDAPTAVESSPFKAVAASSSDQVRYAWEQFQADLHKAATRWEQSHRADPLRPFIAGADQDNQGGQGNQGAGR